MALMDLAIRQALRSHCRQRVGAVLIAGNRILAASPNRIRNAPEIDHHNASFHAEEATLRRAARTYGLIMYVARVNKSGAPMLAAPCPRCKNMLTKSGISRVYFTATTSEIKVLHIAMPGDLDRRASSTARIRSIRRQPRTHL
ncbi:hypothetical protein AB0N93_22250 [Streptomyces sp. NPDC091267]|uniref:hypothetical protein n=1 Tax=unclassified Streptomyces TaxID=2593676 RepID=UPI00343F0DD2